MLYVSQRTVKQFEPDDRIYDRLEQGYVRAIDYYRRRCDLNKTARIIEEEQAA